MASRAKPKSKPRKPAAKRDHLWKKGQAPRNSGRKGKANKITRDLKEGIIGGAEEHGYDGKGLGGMPGYLKMCAKKYPKQYMGLLGRLLPLTIKAPDQALLNAMIGSISIVAAPTDRFLSPEDIKRLNAPPPLTIIDNEPPIEVEPDEDDDALQA